MTNEEIVEEVRQVKEMNWREEERRAVAEMTTKYKVVSALRTLGKGYENSESLIDKVVALIEEEREACAIIADHSEHPEYGTIAKEIRARAS